MPNYIKNRIKIIGTEEQVQEVFLKYNTHIKAKLNKSYDGNIICRLKEGDGFSVGWFNSKTGEFKTREENSNQIGLPENYEFEINDAKDYFPDFEKIITPPNNDAYNDLPNQQAVRNDPEHWYNWNIKNWGTKWNISEVEKESNNTFTFVTAWNGVPKLMLEISNQNPDIEFEYEYADEDTSYNCASYKFKNGEVLETFEPEGGSKEAYELAFKLRPYYASDYVLVDDNYQYNEDED